MPRHRRIAVWVIGLLGALPGLAGVLGGFVLFVQGSASPASWTLLSAGLLLEIIANVLIGKLKSRA
jgi:hypothetical protein